MSSRALVHGHLGVGMGQEFHPGPLRAGTKFVSDVCDQIMHTVEVAWNHLFIFHRNGETILKIGNQLEDSNGIDQVTQQRPVIAQLFGMSSEEVLNEKTANFTLDIYSLH
jgi:hypothetical protein